MRSITRTEKTKIIRHLRDQLAYRGPMRVCQSRTYRRGNTYPVCPRCHSTMEREYMSYCSRCGQCLSWEDYQEKELQ